MMLLFWASWRGEHRVLWLPRAREDRKDLWQAWQRCLERTLFLSLISDPLLQRVLGGPALASLCSCHVSRESIMRHMARSSSGEVSETELRGSASGCPRLSLGMVDFQLRLDRWRVGFLLDSVSLSLSSGSRILKVFLGFSLKDCSCSESEEEKQEWSFGGRGRGREARWAFMCPPRALPLLKDLEQSLHLCLSITKTLHTTTIQQPLQLLLFFLSLTHSQKCFWENFKGVGDKHSSTKRHTQPQKKTMTFFSLAFNKRWVLVCAS